LQRSQWVTQKYSEYGPQNRHNRPLVTPSEKAITVIHNQHAKYTSDATNKPIATARSNNSFSTRGSPEDHAEKRAGSASTAPADGRDG
jgi:hypothetical protein